MKKDLSKRGNKAAEMFLRRRGYEILDTDWSCHAGTVDIVAQDDDAVVFVEVVTRRDSQKGFPSEAVTDAKREKFEKIALAYLGEYDMVDMMVRFDNLSIVVIGEDRALIRHHIGAFSVA